MASHHHSHPAAPEVSPDAVAIARDRHARGVAPRHLYQAAGLLFLLALVFRFFDTLAQTFLLAYAASILAVGMNALQQRLPLQRRWFAAGVGVLVVGTVVGVLWWGTPLLLEQARSVMSMGPGLEQQVSRWEDWIRQQLGVNVKLPRPGGELSLPAGGGAVMGSALGVVEVILFIVVIFFGGLFALAKPNDRLLNPLMRAVPPDLRPAIYRIFQLLGDRLVGWLKGTALAMVGVGLLSVIVWSVIGVPNALLLGIFNGVLEFLPLVGPWIGGITATLMAFLVDPGKAVWVALSALAIQQVEGNLITPFAMSREAEIHPFLTLFALVLFGGMFGFLGLLLALPLVLLVWTVVQVLWVERALDTDRDRIEPVVSE